MNQLSTAAQMHTHIFVSYDLRAIQSFIFRVPHLKYISGGSAIIDEFDRSFASQARDGVTRILSGGGKGTFRCDSAAAADQLEQSLRRQAHSLGIDIRLGRAETLEDAANGADRVYSFLPPAIDGEPCAMSGLFPVERPGDVHPSVRERIQQGARPDSGRGSRHRWFEDRIGKVSDHLRALAGGDWQFLSHIAQPGERDPVGSAGRAALGQSRWAVIAMDGNDMGRQFRVAKDVLSGEARESWARDMSEALDACSLHAVIKGLEKVVSEWNSRLSERDRADCRVDDALVFPFRPLVVGGDDIVVICHARYAFDFACAASDAWTKQSERGSPTRSAKDLWLATGGSTTVSAGILFCHANLPLHTAIGYAEALLASAKAKGRAAPAADKAVSDSSNRPSTPAIDWESVTESVLDHPTHRRRRELEFIDGDDNGRKISLTKRPYWVADVKDLLLELSQAGPKSSWAAKIPRSIRTSALSEFRQAHDDRQLAAARRVGRHPKLAALLKGPESDGGSYAQTLLGWEPPGPGDPQENPWTIGVLDAFSIMDELDRSERENNDD